MRIWVEICDIVAIQVNIAQRGVGISLTVINFSQNAEEVMSYGPF